LTDDLVPGAAPDEIEAIIQSAEEKVKKANIS